MNPASDAVTIDVRITHLARRDELMTAQDLSGQRVSKVHGMAGVVMAEGGGFSVGDAVVVHVPSSGEADIELAHLAQWRAQLDDIAAIPAGLDPGLATLAPMLARALSDSDESRLDLEGEAGRYDTARFLRHQMRLLGGSVETTIVPRSTPAKAALVAAAFGAEQGSKAAEAKGDGEHSWSDITALEIMAALEILQGSSWRFRPVVTSAVTVHEMLSGDRSGISDEEGLEMLVVE